MHVIIIDKINIEKLFIFKIFIKITSQDFIKRKTTIKGYKKALRILIWNLIKRNVEM